MKSLLLAILSVASLHAAPLFDGKSLEGWRVEGSPYWTVRDGILTGESDEAKKNSNLWTQAEYKDFKLTLDFKFKSENTTDKRVDSGVYIRNSSDQIQIGVSGSKKRDLTASPYIAAKKGYPVEAEGIPELLKEGDWNSMTITAKGPLYIVELNGKKVLEYTSDSASEKGPVGLQVHAGTAMKVEFRNIVIDELQ
jgi:hypothetical protein